MIKSKGAMNQQGPTCVSFISIYYYILLLVLQKVYLELFNKNLFFSLDQRMFSEPYFPS